MSGNWQRAMEFFPPISFNENNLLLDTEYKASEELFYGPACCDFTFAGIGQLKKQYPANPGMIISLGVSCNTKLQHEKANNFTKVGFLYERIDYLDLHQKQHADKLKINAHRIAQVLFKNYLLGQLKKV
jgi:hypothetical protein